MDLTTSAPNLSFLLEKKQGFNPYAYFCQTEANPITVQEDVSLPESPGVYLFASGADIVYVGSAHKNIRTRVLKYTKLKKNPRIIHTKLPDLIETCGENPIRIYAKVITNPITIWQGLPFNQVLGLEYGLIKTLPNVLNHRKH